MRTIDLIADGPRQASTRYLFCFPTSILIEACAQARLEAMVPPGAGRGGMADGYSRVTNGSSPASLPCSMALVPKTLTLASRPLSRTASRFCSCRSATPSIARAWRPVYCSRGVPPSRRASKSSRRPRAPSTPCGVRTRPFAPAVWDPSSSRFRRTSPCRKLPAIRGHGRRSHAPSQAAIRRTCWPRRKRCAAHDGRSCWRARGSSTRGRRTSLSRWPSC